MERIRNVGWQNIPRPLTRAIELRLACHCHDSATNASATTSTRQNVAGLFSDRAFHVQDVELVLAGAKGKFELIRLSLSGLDHTHFGSTLPSSGWGAASRRSKK